MSSHADSGSKRSRKSRARVGKLRRFQEIDRVMVEESFLLNKPATTLTLEERTTGEGCYISATVNNRRYYGVLIDQDALKAASLLYFQNEASGLDLNRRMNALRPKDPAGDPDGRNAEGERRETGESVFDPRKKAKSSLTPDQATSNIAHMPAQALTDNHLQVQKFRYIVENTHDQSNQLLNGYRVLLATYATIEAAGEDDTERIRAIESACRAGGGYVGDYFYQFESPPATLETGPSWKNHDAEGMRMSMGFHSFLQNTPLPQWYPLSNLHTGQQQVLNILSMKKDNNGNLVWGDDFSKGNGAIVATPTLPSGLIPMEEQRALYRVCIVGGGIAGLSCALELLMESKRDNIEIEVFLLEARSRLGGRLWTDRNTFAFSDGVPFPVDLGASWIHGIELNPLATLAREANVTFVTTTEEVRMFQENMEVVDKEKDEYAGKMFDKLLDLAADACWREDDEFTIPDQQAVRWYASILGEIPSKIEKLLPVAPAQHRISADTSVDRAVGRAIAKHKLSDFSKLSAEERRMLLWNLKNVEYALGANVSDLSMQYWDIDERHAFEGDHVILKQGYATVVEHLDRKLQAYGERFKKFLDFPVGRIEYARKSTTVPYAAGAYRNRQFVDLSDICRVSSADGSRSFLCDFVVSAVPLGVLKDSVSTATSERRRLEFDPPLPFTKTDAIASVGFGILNKVYLQFSSPFWRLESALGENQSIFGNATGHHPHFYMFFDIGKTISADGQGPAILLSMVSGKEAVQTELLSDTEVIGQMMSVLRLIFSSNRVPDPVSFRVTRWGSDPYSRGSYTFLPPGTTDEDFQLLQSPINGNGDSLLLEGSETMRIFFCGEHTTALHPSMAHGAMLSGVRAAKEIWSSISVDFDNDETYDRLIPLSLFRHMNPLDELRCAMCYLAGSRVREGSLLAFKRGSRQVLVHNNCAENSPEVEVFEGRWKHVLKAVNRSKALECFLCGQCGASVGCSHENCYRCFHFSCAEDTGWRFEEDGKEYFCDSHRSVTKEGCTKISLDFYRLRHSPTKPLLCDFCGTAGNDSMVAFVRGSRSIVVHVKCARFTTVVEISEDTASRFENDFRNIFEALDKSLVCSECGKGGATVRCSERSCSFCIHVPCGDIIGWNFPKQGKYFRCPDHREKAVSHLVSSKSKETKDLSCGDRFQHALFQRSPPGSPMDTIPGNLDMGDPWVACESFSSSDEVNEADSCGEDDDRDCPIEVSKAMRLTASLPMEWLWETQLTRVIRDSTSGRWNLDLYATPIVGSQHSLLTVARATPDPYDSMEDGDIVTSINGIKIGSVELDTLDKVLSRISQEADLFVEVKRKLSTGS